jgi:hypothetical protein
VTETLAVVALVNIVIIFALRIIVADIYHRLGALERYLMKRSLREEKSC